MPLRGDFGKPPDCPFRGVNKHSRAGAAFGGKNGDTWRRQTRGA